MKELQQQEALRLTSPYPYALLVTLDARDRPNIMGLSWWTFTSWDPLMIGVSVSTERYTHECLQHAKEFTLCFPSEQQAKDAWMCGTKSGRDVDKFKVSEFMPVHSTRVRPPMLEGATIAYECRVINEVQTGDHILYIAEVEAIHGNPDKHSHLYTIHYTKLISLGSDGSINMNPGR
ncbi:MAG: flavin reductase family protein [Nitrospira sp.]|nr:flavin reductase family protein [Nitrospira sp.]